MAQESKIQWTDATWNPFHGCKKVSPACKYCYMFRDKERYGLDPTDVVKSKTKFNEPLKWKDPKLIFTCSWSDFFIEQADEWRKECWEIIKKTPQHTYQILTKRPERIMECLPDDWGDGYENVWIGISVENQEMANKRIPTLLDIPCKLRFLSVEPILERVDLTKVEIKDSGGLFFNSLKHIDWVIVGGESGNETGKYRYRPSEIEWFEKIVIDCKMNCVPLFVKQLGTFLAKKYEMTSRHGSELNEFYSISTLKNLNVRNIP